MGKHNRSCVLATQRPTGLFALDSTCVFPAPLPTALPPRLLPAGPPNCYIKRGDGSPTIAKTRGETCYRRSLLILGLMWCLRLDIIDVLHRRRHVKTAATIRFGEAQHSQDSVPVPVRQPPLMIGPFDPWLSAIPLITSTQAPRSK